MTQPLEPEPVRERTAVLLIAHGSRHAPANDDLHELSSRFAAQGTYPIVEACFLELAEPDIACGGERCVALGARRVLMVPYFLSEGVHLRRDLTAARDQLRRHFPNVEFRLGPALGPHPLLDALVAERIRQTDRSDSTRELASTSEMAERYAPMAEHGAGSDPISSVLRANDSARTDG